MKILLLGEFSGVHNNLKAGLLSIGYKAYLAADGDGGRNFKYDFRVAPHLGRGITPLKNIIYFIFNIRKFIGYDIVQFISPFVFPFYYHWFGLPLIVYKLNKRIYYYACGTDPAYLEASKILKYRPFDDSKSINYPKYNKNNFINIFDRFINNIDHIIPAMYDYYIGYAKSPKVLNPIPLPGSGFKGKESVSTSLPIKIIVAVTRDDIKGVKYIKAALAEIELKHKGRITTQYIEKLPIKEYLKTLESFDILIDQCKSYSYGMNALFGMERSIIVLSGSEKIAMEYLGAKNCPVVNIEPDMKQIFETLDLLLKLSKVEINKLKTKSASYVDSFHNPANIANKFMYYYKSL